MLEGLKSNNKVRNKKLKCSGCGADFICTSGPPGSCWCQNSPNLLENWDLADNCLCPDCLAAGQRDAMLAKRENHLTSRKFQSLRKKNN